MLDTSARLLALLSLLQTRRDWTGAELAERFGVTTRTIRNDVGKLRALGYPIEAAPGVAGGYRLGAGARMPPLLLDDEEAVAVAVSLRTAAGGSVTGIGETAVRALAKLEQVLPARLRRRVAALHGYTVPLPGTPSPVRTEVLTTLATVCRDHERLRFDYRDHDGTAGVRTVEPHRLVHSGRRWYLLAWDLDRQDWRTFRADRIEPRVPTGPRFAPRELPDEEVARRVTSGLAMSAWRYRARVVVHAPADVIARRLPPGLDPPEVLGAGRCAVHVGSDDPELLARYLCLLGADFEVRDAPELAGELRRLSDRLRRAAGSG
ncbi:putative DNA-binding transcriptional regulator YafY [Prauserella shujinwangii]|uniref:Putative DNA-binding transcriptional regulator YafY n=1 Tax=Prauserella shujinwangii TaxID=1453103 RepID=A0A2T0LZB2_9PSEU|nr:YafY family protein [Prauserella shujinwangii]PRX49458.1 putative DNA-binding transcriptional regulator YafY [Prauserella shujinwangii]